MPKLFSEIIPTTLLENVQTFSYFDVLDTGKAIELIPSGHATYYPLKFSKASKKVLEGELNFFNKNLYENYNESNIIATSAYELNINKRKEKCLVVNVLDNCFGHSLLKILNLQKIHAKYGSEYDLIVLTPRSLKYLIPKDKFTICTIKYSYAELENCYNLKPILDHIKQTYASYDFVTTSTYETYPSAQDLRDFFFSELNEQKKEYITFYYRTNVTRKWAGKKQAKRVTKLFKYLKPFFNNQVTFKVIGEKDKHTFPGWIIDDRVETYNRTVDENYNTIFAKSIITVGVHGSSLLLPSLLSQTTTHLLSFHKRHNVAEDVVNFMESTLTSWYGNIHYFGNASLRNIAPKKLGDHIIILFSSYLEKKYKQEMVNLSTNKTIPSQAEYIETNFNYFDYNKTRERKNKLERISLYKSKIRAKLGL